MNPTTPLNPPAAQEAAPPRPGAIAKRPGGPDFGRCWVFGDDINTDFLAPGKYMKFDLATLASHCLASVDASFARDVRPGDLIIAGHNFGTGSSREQAVEVLRHLGVQAVVARSFAGLFYRNGFNLGLPLLVSQEAPAFLGQGQAHLARLDLPAARLILADTGKALRCEPVPSHLQALIDHGGLLGYLRQRIATHTVP